MFDQLLSSLPKDNQFLQGGLVMMVFGAAVAWSRSIPGRLYKLFMLYGTVTFQVSDNNESFKWVVRWLEQHEYSKRSRRVTLFDRFLGSQSAFVPAPGSHWFMWRGRPLWLTISEEAQESLANGRKPQTILLRTVSRRQQVFMDLLMEAKEVYRAPQDVDKLRIFTIGGGGHGERKRPGRKLSTLFLAPHQLDVLEDMKRFLTRKDWYVNLGVPYRRGYLFHGPPGTGKSSVAAAFAFALGIRLYIMNLATMTDNSLQDSLGWVHSGNVPGMLLLEDIDAVSEKRAEVETVEALTPSDAPESKGASASGRTAERRPFSLSTLLNSLDGVLASENLILVITTNRKDALDPALLRPGRVDKMVEFGPATDDQLQAAIAAYGARLSPADFPRPITMAQVQQRLQELS